MLPAQAEEDVGSQHEGASHVEGAGGGSGQKAADGGLVSAEGEEDLGNLDDES